MSPNFLKLWKIFKNAMTCTVLINPCSGEVICDILNNSTIEGAIGGIRVNHILYADALCTISLSSASLWQLLVQCDDYCRKHYITFNVSKSICMFFSNLMLTTNVILLIYFYVAMLLTLCRNLNI